MARRMSIRELDGPPGVDNTDPFENPKKGVDT
jgi:hypothetical protein